MKPREMTKLELMEYTGAFYGWVLGNDHLWVADRPGDWVGYLLYGDLREAFAIGDESDSEHRWGNHLVAHMLETSEDYKFAKTAVLDPEGLTFFAYTAEKDDAIELADYIAWKAELIHKEDD